MIFSLFFLKAGKMKVQYNYTYFIDLNLFFCRCNIVIEYSTDPTASALQWLSPEQTAGGKLPYLFSQCQVIFLLFHLL